MRGNIALDFENLIFSFGDGLQVREVV